MIAKLINFFRHVIGCIVGHKPQQTRYIKLNEIGMKFNGICYFHVDSSKHHKVVREYANGDVEIINSRNVWQRIPLFYFEDVNEKDIITP